MIPEPSKEMTPEEEADLLLFYFEYLEIKKGCNKKVNEEINL